ncbi:MAG: DUF1844 domain-containing protein [Sedimentisphaerales bacterium]|nr:DUF1844 domain-containing protein [Sedimentisphaerales bacterium]
MGDEADKKPSVIHDEDWKQQAQKEKEKFSETKEAEGTTTQGGKAAGAYEDMPPASFLTLVNSLVVQTLYSLGRLGDPESKKAPPVNLDLAKHHIDMLGVLEEKTKGNLTAEESQGLSMALHEMRMLYVQSAS